MHCLLNSAVLLFLHCQTATMCRKNALPLTWALKNMQNIEHRHYKCVHEPHGLQESALNGLNTGKNKKEMQFINFSEDSTLSRLCKWQFLCQLWRDSRAGCETVSQKLFKWFCKLSNEVIGLWIAQHYNYFTRALLACNDNPLRCVISLRSAFLETADQTSQRDFQPIVIGNRSIGAPLNLLRMSVVPYHNPACSELHQGSCLSISLQLRCTHA